MKGISICNAGSPETVTGTARKTVKSEEKNLLKFIQLICLTATLLFGQAGLAQNGADASMLERININQADAETIAAVLDGVGLSRAEAIVDYREINGDFKSLEELMMVSGIGEVTVRNNQDRISFE